MINLDIKRFRIYRKLCDVNQIDAAIAIGISSGLLSKLENGKITDIMNAIKKKALEKYYRKLKRQANASLVKINKRAYNKVK